MTRLLLADDDHDVRRAYVRILSRCVGAIDEAESGGQANDMLATRRYDAVLSDVCMPGMDGAQLLGAIRARGLHTPVILMSAAPTLDVAMQCLEHGAVRYLAKPVEPDTLRRVVGDAVASHPGSARDGDGAADFDAAVEQLWMAFQPIVDIEHGSVFAYEALLRTRHAALANPAAFLDAAERLSALPTLGHAIRRTVAGRIVDAPAGAHVFVNLHPMDLLDEDLYSPKAALTAHASRVVLEITERAKLDGIPDLKERIRWLRALGYRIALDDLGAGYAGLSSLATLEPDVVKVDMSLVREIDRDPKKQRLLSSLREMCSDLGMAMIAEGVETEAELDTLKTLGCSLLQGYVFARPQPTFVTPQLRRCAS